MSATRRNSGVSVCLYLCLIKRPDFCFIAVYKMMSVDVYETLFAEQIRSRDNHPHVALMIS